MKIIKIFAIVLVFLGMLGSSPSLGQTYKIAIVKSYLLPAYDTVILGVKNELSNEKIACEFSYYDLEGNLQRAEEIFKKIKSEQTDLILTVGTFATRIAKDKINRIPVVFTCVLNPIASGIVPSFASSGSNLTGVSLDIPFSEQISNFRSVVPHLKEIGVLFNPKETGLIVYRAKEICKKLGIKLREIPIGASKDVPKKLKMLEGVDGLWMTADSTVFTPRNGQFILLYTIRNKIPFMGISEEFVKSGALLAKYLDYEDIGRQTATQIIKILQERKQPENIAISIPRKIKLALNLKVAKKIDLQIPTSIVKKAGIIYK